LDVSVILSTYNNPAWLEKSVWGYAVQSFQNFELIIADDGSGNETCARIDALRSSTKLNIVHVWHEDQGFRKTTILNKAIAQSTGDYLVFSDGDCIPRNDFLAVHVHSARRQRFLSGGYVKLPMQASHAITVDDIRTGRAFRLSWLRAHGLSGVMKPKKLWMPSWFNRINHMRLHWSGNNSSTWRTDIMAVNGFNQDMGYMYEDLEFGQRLMNAGVLPKQVRYSAICCHLDHPRPYRDPETYLAHYSMLERARTEGTTWIANGIYAKDSASAPINSTDDTDGATQ